MKGAPPTDAAALTPVVDESRAERPQADERKIEPSKNKFG
jgi:hypothetical protein